MFSVMGLPAYVFLNIVYGFRYEIKYLIPFQIVFVHQREIGDWIYILHMTDQFIQLYLLKKLFLLHYFGKD